MKKLFNFRLLVLIGVLITSLTTNVWATATVNGGTFYFDASTRSWNDVYMCVGKDSWTDVYTMTNITNTRLFYKNMDKWDGSTYIRFIACNWGGGSWGPSNYNCGYGYTNIYGADYTFNSNSLYLFTTASSANGADVYTAYQSSYTLLNGKKITVKAKVSEDNGRNYSEVTSPATLTASSHEYNSYNSCSTSTSLSNGTISCGYAATTTLTAPDTDPTGYAFVGWYDSGGTRWTTDKTVTVYPTGDATFYAYYRKLYSIASSSTVVFDLGLNDMNSGNNPWSAVYLYRDRNGQSAQNDQLTQIGTTNQYSKTYASTQSNLSCILFRGTTANWDAYSHTTNICRNISEVTLFTYSNSMSYDDNKYKADWQVTTDAKKATSGKKIYFDNTNVSTWTTIYLKYGTNWTSGGFNRVTSAATKVNGTSNLYCITIPNDLYYKEYYLSNATGNTGYHDIETMTGISARTAYQTSNIDANVTLIANTGSGAGTAGNPKVWSVDRMSGYQHEVTISAPSHGTITVSYKNESNVDQSPTSGTFAVARTCSLTVSSSAATGYNPSTLTINDVAHTSGNEYIIRSDITVAATFTPKSCTITFDKEGGDDGDDGETATYDADMPTIDIPSKEGYIFGGYWDGDDGTGNQYYNSDGTSTQTWNKNTESETTLYAKWTEDTHTVAVVYKYGDTELGDAEVTGVGITTTQDAVAPSITGYDFTTWSAMPSGVTTASSLTSSTITINATADSKTITANYTPKEYSGTVDKTTGTTDGTYSVTFKTTSLSASGMAKAGYHVSGYFLSYSKVGSTETFNNQVADGDGNLIGGQYYNDKQCTNSSKEWMYTDEEDIPTLYAQWTGNSHILKLYKNDETDDYESTDVTVGSNSYTIEKPTRAGYDFDGFYTASTGGTQVIDANLYKTSPSDYFDASSNWKYDDNVDLYAHWTEVDLEFVGTTDDDWNDASNWASSVDGVDPCVPTKNHDVTISAEAMVSGSAVAKSVTINQSTGSLTIASTGTLDVIGTISNAAENRLEVMAGGALIFDYTSAPAAKVHHSVSGGVFRYIALPISYVHVSNAFAGQGVYTYVWHEGSGWERRGYYDDISGNEPIAISGQSSWTFYGTLANALFGSVAYTSGKTYAGMNMYANSWTAPIRISGVTISGTGAIQTVYTDNGGSWSPTTAGDPGNAVIPAMSAFVILSNEGGGSVSIPYNTAVRNVAVSPASAPKRVASDDIRKHITMNVSGNELTTNMRLYENEQFSNEFDNGWEAPFLEGDGRAGQLYSQTDDKMVILATPDLEGTVVGFIPGEATDYTISFEGDGKGYYLNDLDMQESTLIEEGNTYVFTPNESTNATRFVISKTPIHKTTTGNDAIYDGSKARKQMIDGILYIIRDGRIYDATGVLVK